jgi:hypothetical protein
VIELTKINLILYALRAVFLYTTNSAIIGFNAPACFGCQQQPSSGSYS